MPLPIAPMLATRGAAFPGDGWAWEPKLDGWRAVLAVDQGRLHVFTRHGNDVTASVPELAPLAGHIEAAGVGTAVFDGELVAGDGRASSFYRLSGRMAASGPSALTAASREPVTFVAFDVVSLDGADVARRPLAERRALLAAALSTGPHWHVTPSWDAEGPDVLTACERLGIEGAVAKRLDSTYRPGTRTDAWLKFKTATWRQYHGPRRAPAQQWR